MHGAVGKGVALLAIFLLETFLLKQVLCTPIGLPRREAELRTNIPGFLKITTLDVCFLFS